MIRLAGLNDINGLIVLWKEAFGDTEESIRFFLERRFRPQNTVVAEDNGEIVSMLFLLEGKVSAENVFFDAYYLYAAATLKSHRGRGIMAKMLDFAKNLASERNVDMICLKPADDGLYDYYAKYGYKTVFTTKTVTVNGNDTSNKILNITEKCSDYFSIRENTFNDYGRFIWDNDAIEFATDFHMHYGGKLFKICNGYCLYTENEGAITVKEICFTPDFINAVLPEISSDETLNFEIDLPVDFPFDAEQSVIKRNGMALAVTNKGSKIYIYNDLYLNLTLD